MFILLKINCIIRMVIELNNNIEIFDSNKKDGLSVIDTYGENLTKKTYIVNPAIGRDKEIKEVILILLTPEKSALLVGKPGVGKTAIVEGLSYKIQRGEVPDALKKFQLIKINVSSLLGNIQSDGVSENKLQLLVEELKKKKDIILFIDEVHLLIGRNTSNLNVDFANMLKPGLDRGDIIMIGATTDVEYEQYILRDRAFLRRFQRVDVYEPTEEETIEILMGSILKIEKQTGVKCDYTDFTKERICKFIVEMTDKYKRIYEIGNRYPDIALSLLGNAFSNAMFENTKYLRMHHIYNAIKNTKSVYEKIKKQELEKFKEEFADDIKDEKDLI